MSLSPQNDEMLNNSTLGKRLIRSSENTIHKIIEKKPKTEIARITNKETIDFTYNINNFLFIQEQQRFMQIQSYLMGNQTTNINIQNYSPSEPFIVQM